MLNRRELLKASGLAAAALLMPKLARAAGASTAPARKPNILFLFSDQQRHDTIECYGKPIFSGLTPNIDRMAANGVRFQNNFTCQPLCTPARATLQTGKYPTQTTCFKNGIALARSEKTMAHLLSAVGYEVGYIGKWHLESGGKPFFLFVSYLESHHQNDHGHFEGPHGSKEKFREFQVPDDLKDAGGNWRVEMPDYLGCCNSLDANVGRIRDELSKLGLADNTLVIYSSDHACHFKTRDGEYKRTCHDDSARTPLIIAGPGFTGGEVVEEMVSILDLTPTVLAAGGANLPDYLAGRPLQGLVDGSAKDWPLEVFVQISESTCGRAVRTKRWTYCVEAPKGQARFGSRDSEVYHEAFLYDLQADPGQRKNLVASAEHEKVRAELRETLLRRMAGAGEKPPKILPKA
jgi:arylsulfatase A-like enzyme